MCLHSLARDHGNGNEHLSHQLQSCEVVLSTVGDLLVIGKYYVLFGLCHEGEGQVMTWDPREIQNSYVSSTGEPWQNQASESEDSSRSGSETRTDRTAPR